MAGLRVAAGVCKELLIIETLMDDLHRWKPSMVYFPSDSYNKDSTNYWAPNVAAMKGMLHDLGFSRVEVVFPKNRFVRYSLPMRILSSIKGLFEVGVHSDKRCIRGECLSTLIVEIIFSYIFTSIRLKCYC